MRNNVEIKNSPTHVVKVEGERHSLLIKWTKPSDGGTYTITATNEVGKASSSATLFIKPGEYLLLGSLPDLSRIMCHSLKLCFLMPRQRCYTKTTFFYSGMTCPQDYMITKPFFSDTSLESEISSLIYLESLTLMCIEHHTEKQGISNPPFSVFKKLPLKKAFERIFCFPVLLPCPPYFLCNHVKDYLKGKER